MTTERFQRGDKRLLLILAAVVAVSVVYTLFNVQAVFPEASLDLRFSKSEITGLARNFLREQGLSTAGFRNLTLFDPDQSAQVYLEREMGLAEANRLMQGPVAVWRWRARWFRPPDEEELVVYLNPRGALVGFHHRIPEAAPGTRLDKESARTLAAAFLAGRSQAPQRLIEEQLQERPARYDYAFTWEQENFRAKDATYRRTITIQGDKVGRYSEYLYVPEKWKRDFATLRSSNNLYSRAAEVLYILLVLAAVVVLIQFLRRRAIFWKPLVVIAGAVGVLMVVNEWNAIPFAIDGMPTSSPYTQSLLRALFGALGAGLGVFFYVILAAAPGEPLYRASQPSNLSLLQLPSLRSIRTREFFRATIVGYGFAAAHIAFVVAFYLIGRRVGVWSPQDVNYSDFLSTRLPWIYPLTISLLASTSEEFWFRLFAIPLLKRYLRSTWLAVVIPAFLWGFLHSNYPQQPGFIRGVEVGVIGIAAGFLMLRFGIVATLVWHYTVDAVLIGMFLFRSGSLYFQVSGWVVSGAVLFPLALSLLYYKKHGGFLVDPALLNSGQRTPEAATPLPAVEVAPAPRPQTPRWPVKWLYAAAAVAALAGLALPRSVLFGDFIRVRITGPEAETAALRELRARVPGVDGWRRVTTFESNLGTAQFEYLRRIAGSQAANQAIRDHTSTGMWAVRFFQPLRKEEWRVYVDQQGRVVRLDHVLDEKAAGAQLPSQEARGIAERYLSGKTGVPMERYRLVDSSSQKRDRRTDHSFVWEDPDFQIGEAKARISLAVLGDTVSGYRSFLKLPQEWLREFSKPRMANMLLPAAFGAAGFWLLVLFIRRLTQAEHRYHWRAYLLLGSLAACLAALTAINQWPLALAGYDTATPLDNYLSQFLLARVVIVVLAGFALFLAALAADLFLQSTAAEAALRRPSLARAAAVALLLWGLARVAAFLWGRIPGPRRILPLWDLPGAGTYAPAVGVAALAFFSAAIIVCALVVSVSATRSLTTRSLYVSVALCGLVVASGRALSLPQFVYYFAATILVAAVVAFLIRTCAADLWTFGLALFWLLAAEQAVTLVEQPAAMLRWNGIACLAVALCLGAALLSHRGYRMLGTGTSG